MSVMKEKFVLLELGGEHFSHTAQCENNYVILRGASKTLFYTMEL